MEQRYANEIVGANLRMTDVSAAIGRVQLAQLPAWTEQRRGNAAFLDARLTGLRPAPVADDVRHVYHQYTVRVPANRVAVQEQLRARGVASTVYYPTPIHRLKPYLSRTWDLPETDRASAEVLSLPVHPSLSGSDLDRIVAAVNDLFN
jgi:dTDP-4-amino-4,6-dideoxygalactose transaminase